MGFPGGSDEEESACNARGSGWILRSGIFPGEGNGYPLGQEYSLEKGMATHSSIFVWRIPWTEKPDGL